MNRERKHKLNEQVAPIPIVPPPAASTASSMAAWSNISCHFTRNVTWPEIHIYTDTNVHMEIRKVVFQFSKNE